MTRDRARAAVAERFKDERGETLSELLMTILIMGIAFVSILAGLGTAIALSGVHRGQANADVVIVSAADAVKSQTQNAYVACNLATTSSYSPTTGVTLPSGWTAANLTITSVKGWNGTAFATCTSGSTDNKIELVTVQAVTPGTPSTTESVDVLKRNPA